VAVQAVVVGVLMVIVFITLLQPEDQRPFSGIEGPALPNRTSLPGPDIYTGATHPGGGGAGQPGNPGGGPGTEAGGAAVTPTAPGTAPVTPETPAPGAGGTDRATPSEDQYADTLTRLVMRLN
jgi:hypothetical protein